MKCVQHHTLQHTYPPKGGRYVAVCGCTLREKGKLKNCGCSLQWVFCSGTTADCGSPEIPVFIWAKKECGRRKSVPETA